MTFSLMSSDVSDLQFWLTISGKFELGGYGDRRE